MANVAFVALLISGVTASPMPWQQRTRGASPISSQRIGPSPNPGVDLRSQAWPHVQFGSDLSRRGDSFLQPSTADRYRPGIMGPNTGMMSPRLGMMGPRPGMMGPRPGMMGPRPGMMGPRPGMMGPRPGMMGPRPGMMGPRPGNVDGDYFPNPGGPTFNDWNVDELDHPWLPGGLPEIPGGQEQVDSGWTGQDDEFNGASELPERGDQQHRMFTPILKLDNITLPNVTGLPFKEGENIFLLPMVQKNVPQELRFGYPSFGLQPYVKLIYNPTATQRISFEYGLTQLLPSFMKVDSKEDKNAPQTA